MLKINKTKGCFLAELSLTMSSDLIELFKYSEFKPPASVSRTMLKIKNGEVSFIDNKNSRPLVKYNINTGVFEPVLKYDEGVSKANQGMAWIYSLQQHILESIVKELEDIHSRFYKAGSTAVL